jgi:hypothetical protein
MRQFQLQQYIVGSTGAGGLAGILDGAIFTTKDTIRNTKEAIEPETFVDLKGPWWVCI